MISILLLAGFSIKGECPKVHISLLIYCFGFNTDSDCLHCSTLLWIVINQVPVVESLIKLILQGAGMAQWWEYSPPTNVSRVWLPDPGSYVGWVCCWFSSLLREVFLRALRFSPLLKNPHSQFQFDLGWSSTLSWASGSGDCASTPFVWH